MGVAGRGIDRQLGFDRKMPRTHVGQCPPAYYLSISDFIRSSVRFIWSNIWWGVMPN